MRYQGDALGGESILAKNMVSSFISKVAGLRYFSAKEALDLSQTLQEVSLPASLQASIVAAIDELAMGASSINTQAASARPQTLLWWNNYCFFDYICLQIA